MVATIVAKEIDFVILGVLRNREMIGVGGDDLYWCNQLDQKAAHIPNDLVWNEIVPCKATFLNLRLAEGLHQGPPCVKMAIAHT